MDLSDLPQSAQDRIAAAEIEAESILRQSKIPAKVARIRARIPWAKPDAWPDGPIQEQKRFEQGLFEAVARDSRHQGRIGAARHLLGAAAVEYIRAGNLDTKQFDAKLEAIGDWACKKFRVKRAWFDAEKQGWRVKARRQKDWASVGYAGAITGEALSHAALKLRAEGWKHAAKDGFSKADQTGAVEPSGDESTHNDAVPAANGTNPAKSNGKGRKRGPKPDHEAASQVADIVAREAPDGDWRSKLNVVCEALDAPGVCSGTRCWLGRR